MSQRKKDMIKRCQKEQHTKAICVIVCKLIAGMQLKKIHDSFNDAF